MILLIFSCVRVFVFVCGHLDNKLTVTLERALGITSRAVIRLQEPIIKAGADADGGGN